MRGHTLAEMLIVLTVVGILTTICLPAFGSLRDSAAVHGAATELMAELAVARHTAILRGIRVAVRIDAPRAAVSVHAENDTILARSLRTDHGVTLRTTRDSIAYAPTGLGYGASNTTVVLHRGRATDTVVVSRLGRARRGEWK